MLRRGRIDAMKLPEKLPALEAPVFILSNPVAVQVAVLFIAILVPPAAWVWVFREIAVGRAEFVHYALALVTAAIFLAGLYPPNWRRWVTFAADRKGVYLGIMKGDYVHVPWAQVGPTEIGTAGRGSNRQRTVILLLRLPPEVLERLLGKYQRRATRIGDSDGFVPYGIGNALRNVEATQREIERIRELAIGTPQTDNGVGHV